MSVEEYVDTYADDPTASYYERYLCKKLREQRSIERMWMGASLVGGILFIATCVYSLLN